MPVQHMPIASKAYLSAVLSSSPLYMVNVHTTRSGRREYRTLAVVLGPNGSCAIEDVTHMVCIAIGELWDELRGTYRATPNYRSQDARHLGNQLTNVLGHPVVCTIL